jgi:hypothetical protein
MVISFDPTWTSTTAIIKFMNEEVGELQDFTLDENFNIQRIQGIGNPADLKHVPGIYQATLTSRRAYLKANKIFTLLSTLDASKISGTFDATTKQVTITDADALASALQDTVLTRGVVGVTINFDVEVSAKYVDTSASPTAVKTQTIYTLNECSITSRGTSLTTGNVIIFENLTMFPKYKTMGNQIISSAL